MYVLDVLSFFYIGLSLITDCFAVWWEYPIEINVLLLLLLLRQLVALNTILTKCFWSYHQHNCKLLTFKELFLKISWRLIYARTFILLTVIIFSLVGNLWTSGSSRLFAGLKVRLGSKGRNTNVTGNKFDLWRHCPLFG